MKNNNVVDREQTDVASKSTKLKDHTNKSHNHS